MAGPPPQPGHQPGTRSSRFLFFVLIGIIIAGIAAFLILRPNPSNDTITDPTTHH